MSSCPVAIPLWLKLGYTLMVAVIVPVYSVTYGPANFLWLSDFTLLATTIALWTGQPLLWSMPAVGVLPLEIAWTADFLTGGSVFHLAGYMFDPQYPLYLRGLSLFHLALPPTIVWLLWRWGYDSRAGIYQAAFTVGLLSLCYVATPPAMNINWVFGWGPEPQQVMPPLLYFALVVTIILAAVIFPNHHLLRRLCRPAVSGAEPA